MNTKTKIGMSMKTKKKKLTKKTNIVGGKTNENCRWYLTYSTVVRSLRFPFVSGAAEVAKAINDNKTTQSQLKRKN